MYIDEITMQYQISKDDTLKLLRAYGIEPLFGLAFGSTGYITEKQFQLVKDDLLAIKAHCYQEAARFLREKEFVEKKDTKKEA